MNKPTFFSLHALLPQHTLSRFLGWLADRPLGFVTRTAIRWFIKHYGVNMNEAAISDYRQYRTFNDFFSRPLKTSARPLASEGILSPVDGCVSEMGYLNKDQILQAKNHHYTVGALLADEKRAALFEDGAFLTAYLAPKDYHRIHMPCFGKLTEMHHIPGRLFSVNPKSVNAVTALFARNERVVCWFETDHGPMVMIMVGAMIVGSIATVWHGIVTPPTKRTVSSIHYPNHNLAFAAGDEVGHFRLGSTVILLFPKEKISWDIAEKSEKILRVGHKIAKWR